ncbi:transglycosylase domain-containing protein [Desulfurobacterium atlanticum]|uniref:Penicillin-binding protein 1A n=1 Tax=Desulfurobacterium atlanticum TaxID=240169 RepID=A0A238ZSL3_9BACT|nr:PBP1A family penicillin-binding protein [Desulfurobacterium atlanticum]SNR86001.1 penicillin-binding protein 1A [Desulfurobacterium atlanticum]
MKRITHFIFILLLLISYKALASPSYKEKLLPDFATTVVDRNGKIIGYFFSKHFRLYAPIDEIPQNLKFAVISAEDARFYEHRGIDPVGLLRAAVKDLTAGKIVQGGSTITQQLAKLIFLSPQRTLSRKLKEIGIAKELENNLTKDEILELYLNYVYLGSGAYGVKAAAKVFFGKDLKNLTLTECALLAALIKGPGYYNPFKYPERALRRRNWVLKQMYENGYITKNIYLNAVRQPLDILPAPEKPRTAGYDLDFIKFMAKRVISQKEIYTGGLTIKTTLDSNLQDFAQKTLSEYAQKYSESHEIPDLQCAGMAMTRFGEVLFVVGGTDYKKTKLNRAFQILRPIGSTAKPITYLSAFQKGISPYDYIENTPIELPMETKEKNEKEQKFWRPQNYSSRYKKYIEVKDGLRKSINVATIHLAMMIPKTVKANLKKFRFTNGDFNLSYVLGSFPSNLYRIIRAFSAIENGGILYKPFVIKEINNKHGNLIYKGTPSFTKVADAKDIAILRTILQDVVKNGTARRIAYLTNMFDVAGKTGTTDNWRDAYFTGFTTSFVMSVWYGRDSYKTLWKRADGGRLSAPPWGKIAQKICSVYGCGKFTPSYEEIVKNDYPLPSLPIKSEIDTFLSTTSIDSNSIIPAL